MKHYYCTYFDRNYLAKALSLIDSLNKHEENDFVLFAVCLDEISRTLIEKINPRNVITISLQKIEERDNDLAAAKQNRSLVEYYWTLTPTVLLRIFQEHTEVCELTYVDSDLFFYSSPSPIFEEFREHSVLIHGHRFSPDLIKLEKYGKYNVGLLSFRRDEDGMKVLDWWRDRCNEWCYSRVEDGKFGDQLYLNDWPEKFRGVKILEHIGAGVAPWNHIQYSYATGPGGRVLVDGFPLVFYHFHCLAMIIPELILPANDQYYVLKEEIIRLCHLPYIQSLNESILKIKRHVPSFSFGFAKSDNFNLELTFIAKKSINEAIRNCGVAHKSISLDDTWECFVTPQMQNIESGSEPASGPVLSDFRHDLPVSLTAGETDVSIDDSIRNPRNVTIHHPYCGTELSEKIVIAANLVPFRDESQRQRQEACITSISSLAEKGIVPLNICYPDERMEPAGWQTTQVLQRSANIELKVGGKRKPFVTDLFDIASTWAEKRGIEWFALTNSDIILTEELFAEVRRVMSANYETIAISRNEVERVEPVHGLIPGYLEVNGYDIFACRTDWWLKNRPRFQPYILGERAWDNAYAAIMACHSRFAMLYKDGLCFHVKHPNSWLTGPYAEHNMRLYLGPDKQYSDRYEAFIKEVLATDRKLLTSGAAEALLEKYFPREGETMTMLTMCQTEQPVVNICIVTYNRIDFTRQCIDSLRNDPGYPHVITVVDNNSQDGTGEYLRELHAKGIIKNIVLLEENVGVAKASNLAWSLMPDAGYYLKLDNDIVMQKRGWLSDMIYVIEALPQIGALAYNFEPVSYPVKTANGLTIRIKENGNLGGACILIPRRTEKILGCWCEEYGLYGEEDADYGHRILTAGLLNVYMEDENVGLHLPAGKAAAIDPKTWQAADGVEENEHAEYRGWKDKLRKSNVESGLFMKNLMAYQNGDKSIHMESAYVRQYQCNKANKGKILCSIIIPLFNKVEYTRQCLEALAVNTDQNLNFEIILVDNASSDGTAEYLRKLGGEVTLITNLKNLGFAKACNQGGRLARGRYLVFLNNDTIPHPGWLDALVQGAEQEGADIVGAKLIYPNARTQHAGVAFNERGIGYHIFNGFTADHPAVNRKRFMQCVTGACMLIGKDLFDLLGGFDETFINGFEDVDLCLRAGEMGKKILYNPASVLIHFEETSAGRKSHDYQNAAYFLNRWENRVICDENRIYASEGFRKETQADGRIAIVPLAAPHQTTSNNLSISVEGRAVIPSAMTEYSESGKEYKGKGDFPKALEAFSMALELGDTSVLADMGDCLANMERLEEAILRYGEAICLDKSHPQAHVGIGVVKLLKGDFAASGKAFGNALEREPENSKALCGLGLARYGQGFKKAGIRYFVKALDANPENITALNELIKSAYDLGKFAEAIACSRNYLMYHPGDLDILFSFAGIFYKAGEYDEAKDTIERLLALYPEYQGGSQLLAKILTEQGNVSRHANRLVAGQYKSDTVEKFIKQGRGYKADGKYDLAFECFSKAQEHGDLSVILDMGDCKANMGDYTEAQKFYEEGLRHDPESIGVLVGLGIVLFLKGRHVKAVAAFNKALNLEPSNPKALCGLGMVRNAEGKQKEALNCFSSALDNDPENEAALHELIKLSYEIDTFAEAGDRLTTYLMYHPGDLDMLFSLAGTLYKSARYDDARDSLESLLALSPAYAGGAELLALVLAKIHETSVNEVGKDVVSSNSQTAEKLANLGKTKKEAGNYEEALEDFGKVRALGDESVLPEMGDCKANLGKLDEASDCYEECLKNAPDDTRALVGLGVINLLQGNHTKAVTWFNKTLKCDPFNTRALCGLGMVRNLQNKPKEALKCFSLALDTDPENLSALHEVVKCSYELNRFEEAEKYLQNYLMYHPGDLDMQFSLAGIYFKKGDYASTLENIENLLIFDPEYAGGTELLEKAYTRMGKTV